MTTTDKIAVTQGVEFRSPLADGNPLWRVTRRAGKGVWHAVVVNEPVEIDGRSYDSDYAGTTDVFTEARIIAAVQWAQSVDSMFQASDDWFDSLELGTVVHYNNGFGEFVRCKVVIADDGEYAGRKALLPFALVGDWRPYDLPRRDPTDGKVHYCTAGMFVGGCEDPRNPGQLMQPKVWRPNNGCVFESPRYSSNYARQGDPRSLEPIDLDLPTPTLAEQVTVALHDHARAVIAALQDDSVDIAQRLANAKHLLDTNPGENA